MRHLRTVEDRETHAQNMVHPMLPFYSYEHMVALRIRMTGLEANRAMETFGEGSWLRFMFALHTAEYALKLRESIPENEQTIIEAWQSIPRYYGSRDDDGVDFATPKQAFREALKLPRSARI